MIGTASILVLLLSTIMLYVASFRASRYVLIPSESDDPFLTLFARRSIYTALLHRIFRCTPRWFDITPHGRITNRFTVDISALDEALAPNFVRPLVSSSFSSR
jgi:ABC-type multidrug transport system fused ATPase/permease subunit